MKLNKQVLIGLLVLMPVVAMSQTKNFEGFSVQGSLGYQSTKTKSDDGILSPTVQVYTIENSSGSGLGLNLGLGYTAALDDQFTLGVLAEYNPLKMKAGSPLASSTSNCHGDCGAANLDASIKNMYSISLVPGVLIANDKLVYAKVGYSSGKASYDPNDGTGDVSTTLSGYNLGLGLKVNIDSSLFGFVEGNYISFSNKTMTIDQSSDNPKPTVGIGGGAYNLMVGLGYKF